MSDLGFLRDEETYRASTRVGTNGFSLTRRLPSGEQLQHWIFRKPSDSELGDFDLAAHSQRFDLAAWKTWVRTPLPSGATWGEEPRRGLWIADGTLYVVAQAKRGVGSISELPSPTYPRRAAVERNAPGESAREAAGPSAPPSRRSAVATLMQLDIDAELLQKAMDMQAKAPASEGPGAHGSSCAKPSVRRGGLHEQIGVGDCPLFIGDLAVGRVFGTESLRRPEGALFWETSEYWVFYADRLREAGAGALGVRVSTNPVTTLTEFQRRVQSEVSGSERLLWVVVGCNNYQGREPPPEWFLG